MSASVYTRKFCSLLKRKINISRLQVRTGYYILLPEIDSEAAEKVSTVQNDLISFSDLNADKLNAAIGKKLLDLECMTRNIDRDLEESGKLSTDLFEDIIHPIERTADALSNLFGVVKTLFLTDSQKMPYDHYLAISHRTQVAFNVRFNSLNIYNACRECDRSNLTEEQLRLLELYISEGFQNGYECKERERNLIEHKNWLLLQEQNHFKLRLQTARDQFYLRFEDRVLAEELPDDLLKQISQNKKDYTKGPWIVKLKDDIASEFLEYCSNRDLRWTVWHAEDKVASNAEEERELSNSVTLEKIRFYRYEKATYMGLQNYMEISLMTKMAQSMEEIDSVMSMYLKAAKPSQLQEVLTLQEYANQNGFQHPIQLWDLPFWARKHKTELFNFDNEKWKDYFPLYRVLNGLFSLCNRLFGIKIQESRDAEVWHPDVKFFNVYEPNSSKPIGAFYLDPFARKNKLILEDNNFDIITLRSPCRLDRHVKPLTAIIMNFPQPAEGVPSLLSFKDVRNLFSLFGYNLQYLLSKTTYSLLSGPSNIELDARAVCSRFMINWLYDKKTFDSIHCHYETGEHLKNVDLVGIKNYMAGFNLCKELYKSKMDIRMHSEPMKFWLDMTTETWDDYFIFPLSLYHSDPCRYIDLFGNSLGGSYYSVIWSEMLAADVFNAFFEPDVDCAVVGKRFKDTYLTFGASCSAQEVFRRFRGRDPCPEAYLKNLGLYDSKNLPSDTTAVEDTKLNVAV